MIRTAERASSAGSLLSSIQSIGSPASPRVAGARGADDKPVPRGPARREGAEPGAPPPAHRDQPRPLRRRAHRPHGLGPELTFVPTPPPPPARLALGGLHPHLPTLVQH